MMFIKLLFPFVYYYADCADGPKVYQFTLGSRLLRAKLSREKPYEGRLVFTRRESERRKGDIIMYMCWPKPRHFIILDEPVLHSTVLDGITTVGFRSLVPWSTSAHDCLRYYCALYTKAKKECVEDRYSNVTKEDVVKWHAAVKVPFVTWHDEPLSPDQVLQLEQLRHPS